MSDLQVRSTLANLYRIAEAGEKGYATAAANIPGAGLKILLRSYAQQRARLKTELLDELQRLGRSVNPGASLPGAIHRGRVAIFAALAIEQERQEKVVLKEAALGESVAIHSYERALKTDLPAPTRELIARQLDEIRKVSEQIQLLRGLDGSRMIVQSYHTEKEAGMAADALKEAGFRAQAIEQVRLNEAGVYPGRGATILETVLSGAFGGALWGGLTGILAGFGVVQAAPYTGSTAALAWMLVALAFMLLGAGITAILALFVGIDISADDHYQFEQTLRHAQMLVRVISDPAQAGTARQILGLQRPQPQPGPNVGRAPVHP